MAGPGEDGYRVMSRLAQLDAPDLADLHIDGPDSLLLALAQASDGQGRYYASPKLIAARLCWHEYELTDWRIVAKWISKLIRHGDIRINPEGGTDCYSGNPVALIEIQDRRRFQRFSERAPIPKALRLEIYDRDGWQCVECGDRSRLSLDHIVPWSLGGSDTADNLRVLCRPCNSRKGARI